MSTNNLRDQTWFKRKVDQNNGMEILKMYSWLYILIKDLPHKDHHISVLGIKQFESPWFRSPWNKVYTDRFYLTSCFPNISQEFHVSGPFTEVGQPF